MSTFSIIIATYGDEFWEELAFDRAYPSAVEQGADEVLQEHWVDASIAEVRNGIAAKATSEWLVFLDADDELDPGYISAMRDLADRSGGRDWLLNPKVCYVRNGRRRPEAFLDAGNLQDDNYLIVGTAIKRSSFDDVDGFSDYPHGFEDWSLWAKAWKAGAQVIRVPGATYVAYINPNSKHRQAWKDRPWQVEMHHRVRKDLFPELYS